MNTVKDINDEKYAARTREELRKAMAEEMAKEQSLSESESDMEAKHEPAKPVQTVEAKKPVKKTSRVRKRNTNHFTVSIA